MNKKHKSLLKKQSLKYLVIIIIAILGMGLWRIMWSIPDKPFFWAIGIIAGIFLTMAIFDAVSMDDVIGIFKG